MGSCLSVHLVLSALVFLLELRDVGGDLVFIRLPVLFLSE